MPGRRCGAVDAPPQPSGDRATIDRYVPQAGLLGLLAKVQRRSERRLLGSPPLVETGRKRQHQHRFQSEQSIVGPERGRAAVLVSKLYCIRAPVTSVVKQVASNSSACSQ